jgi:hypothetical protein
MKLSRKKINKLLKGRTQTLRKRRKRIGGLITNRHTINGKRKINLRTKTLNARRIIQRGGADDDQQNHAVVAAVAAFEMNKGRSSTQPPAPTDTDAVVAAVAAFEMNKDRSSTQPLARTDIDAAAQAAADAAAQAAASSAAAEAARKAIEDGILRDNVIVSYTNGEFTAVTTTAASAMATPTCDVTKGFDQLNFQLRSDSFRDLKKDLPALLNELKTYSSLQQQPQQQQPQQQQPQQQEKQKELLVSQDKITAKVKQIISYINALVDSNLSNNTDNPSTNAAGNA